MNQEPKKRTISTWLLVVLIIVLLGGLGYFAWNYYALKSNKTTPTPTPTATTSAKKVSPSPTTASVTADWQTYTDNDYKISFKYPKDWAKPDVSSISADNGLIPISSKWLDFKASIKDKNGFMSVSLSKYSDYSSDYQSGINKIKAVFTNQSADGADKLWLPPEPAAIMAASKPQYIETSDKKFRGIYYFAAIGQDTSLMLDNIIIMTDGKDKLFQFHVHGESAKGNTYLDKINDQSAVNEWFAYVSGLSSSSKNETVIDNFNSTYSLIAKSVESL